MRLVLRTVLNVDFEADGERGGLAVKRARLKAGPGNRLKDFLVDIRLTRLIRVSPWLLALGLNVDGGVVGNELVDFFHLGIGNRDEAVGPVGRAMQGAEVSEAVG